MTTKPVPGSKEFDALNEADKITALSFHLVAVGNQSAASYKTLEAAQKQIEALDKELKYKEGTISQIKGDLDITKDMINRNTTRDLAKDK